MSILAEQISTVKLAGNQTIVSATLIDVTGLGFTVLAGARYIFKFALVFQIAQAVTGVPQVAMTFPTADLFAATFRHQFGTLQFTTTEIKGQLVSSGVGVSASAQSSGLIPFLLTVEGVIAPTVNGTLQLQLAENGNNNPKPYTVYAGSCGILRRVA